MLEKREVYLLLMVILATIMLLVQMHIMENHATESSSSLFISKPTRIDTGNVRKGNPIEIESMDANHGKRDCDKIVDSDEDADEDMKPILRILCRSGYDISKNSTTVDRTILPKFGEILNFYGPPKILGLETCAIYRNKTKQKDRHVAPAGLFNTGTNLLQELISQNCYFKNGNKGNFGMEFEVPWGKHIPFTYRYNHTAHTGNNRYQGMDPTKTLPVVMVRDPYTWMQSMCKQSYAAQYDHNKSSCPNIIPYPSDIESHPRYGKMKYMPVNLKYDKPIRYKYESIAHLWNEWNLDYIKFQEDNKSMKSPTDFPFIVIRLEDLTFHAHTIIPKMCECAGGTVKRDGQVKFTPKIANRNHGVDVSSGTMSGLLRSVVKYGNITRRRDGYPDFQLQAAKEVLDPRLMDILRYPYEDYQLAS